MISKPDLEDFWNMESIGATNNPEAEDDKIAMDNFKDTLTFEDNRYQVTCPWKIDNLDLPKKRELAMGRLRYCVSKLKHKPESMRKYDGIIQEKLNKGIIEKVMRIVQMALSTIFRITPLLLTRRQQRNCMSVMRLLKQDLVIKV